jgi:hypothetical protein
VDATPRDEGGIGGASGSRFACVAVVASFPALTFPAARATPENAAIERLALRGHAISTGSGTLQTTPDVVALDTPRFVRLGHVLPSARRPWIWVEQAALEVDPVAYPVRRWCIAHESLRIRAALAAEGHDLG